MSKQKDATSLKIFGCLLNQRGYRLWPESLIHTRIPIRGKHPDFYVETPWCSFIAEVKSFQEPGPLEQAKDRVGTLDPGKFVKRIARSCRTAAHQLEPYADLNLPMVVVIDNPVGIRIPLTPRYLIQLFGVIEFRGEYDPKRGGMEHLRLVHGGTRQLGPGPNLHPYVSAVVVPILLAGCEGDDSHCDRPVRVRILHNPFATVPLPEGVFSDEKDTIIRYMLTEERWELGPGRWVVSNRGEDGSVTSVMVEDGWDGIRRLSTDSES